MSDLSNKLCIGTVQFGLNYGIANKKGQVKKREIKRILDYAQINSIKSIDTAKVYGKSEEAIGFFLKRSTGEWNITTKIDNLNVSLSRQIENSRKKLNIKPNTILAHSVNLFMDPIFQSEIQIIKNNYSLNSIGVSVYNEKDINIVLKANTRPDVIQLPLNILDSSLYRNGVIKKLANENIKIQARSVFLQGLFYLSDSILKKSFKDVIPYLEKLKSIASNSGFTLAELSLLWLVSLKEVNEIIIGVDNVSHLKTHLDTLNKNIDSSVFEEALTIHYENENILNPSLWPIKS